jgi:hypothetical protein
MRTSLQETGFSFGRNTPAFFSVFTRKKFPKMADKHPSGNPRLLEQHRKIQQQGDEELAGTARTRPDSKPRKPQRTGANRSEPETDTENSGFRTKGGSSVGP